MTLLSARTSFFTLLLVASFVSSVRKMQSSKHVIFQVTVKCHLQAYLLTTKLIKPKKSRVMSSEMSFIDISIRSYTKCGEIEECSSRTLVLHNIKSQSCNKSKSESDYSSHTVR